MYSCLALDPIMYPIIDRVDGWGNEEGVISFPLVLGLAGSLDVGVRPVDPLLVVVLVLIVILGSLIVLIPVVFVILLVPVFVLSWVIFSVLAILIHSSIILLVFFLLIPRRIGVPFWLTSEILNNKILTITGRRT